MPKNEERTLLENVVARVRKKLKGGCSDEKKFKYLKHLENLEIDVDILRKTGIGKTVHRYQRKEGVIGKKATELIIKWKHIAESYSKRRKYKLVQGGPPDKLQKCGHKLELPEVANLTSVSSDEIRFSKVSRNTVNGNDEISSDLCQTSLEKEIGNKVDGNAEISISGLPSISLTPKRLSGKKDTRLNLDSEAFLSSKHKQSNVISGLSEKRRKQQGGTCQEDGDSDSESEEKYKNVSFADMLMMPLLELKKKKKFRRNLLLEKAKISLPSLPDINLESIDTLKGRPIPSPVTSKFLNKKIKDTPARLNDIAFRKTRSHMYKGKKRSIGTVISLFQLCMRVLIENIDSLYETGGVPCDILRPLLTKCNPYHLERLEEYNPHFLEDTDILWKAHCQREFRDRTPSEMETWKELYKRLYVEREARFHTLSLRITAQQAVKAPERSVKLVYVSSEVEPVAPVVHNQKVHFKMEVITERKELLKEKLEKANRDAGVAVPFANVHLPRRKKKKKKKKKLGTRKVPPHMFF